MADPDIAAIRDFLRRFAAERDWEQFHTPKNLVMAMAGEVGELAEIFQWLTAEESAAVAEDPSRAGAVADELVDVLQYLIRLADVLDIDLDEAVHRKFAANAERYPADEVKGSAEKR